MAEKEGKENTEGKDALSPHAAREERVLRMWEEKGIFKKSVETPAGNAPVGDFTFYDGPPFATGLPHYGHILAGTIKDVIPRWKSMQGYRVRRRWGWDCHGLPVENLVEKELGLATKKDIVSFGIGKFNEAARESVMRYADEWRKIIPRLGRWVDMDDDYRTMDASYTESVWWIFKRLHESGLIYEGFKSMNLCPRCETTLSNFEVAQGYKDITDISVTAKFELSGADGGTKDGGTKDGAKIFILAWTTTPWTLPGNVALAVNPEIDYVKVRLNKPEAEGEAYIVAKERAESVFRETGYSVVETFKGSELVGRAYKPLFDYYAAMHELKNRENGWKIYGAGFVTTEDGTGIVHIAPAFGADDYDLLLANKLPFVQHVTFDGHFKVEVTDFAGQAVKPKPTPEDKDAHQKADIEIIKWLAKSGGLFAKEKLVHSYPHCWRCETPLLNYAASSWFVKVTDLKEKLVAENKKVAWVPPEVGEGRFGNWLEGARDWAISRSRFWGAPIPVWRTEKSKESVVIGSVEDLKSFSKAKNIYYVMRHGEAVNNTQGILSGDPAKPHHLTELGKEQAAKGAAKVKEIKPDLIYTSPFVRTVETAEIVREGIGLETDKVITDERIREIRSGDWDGKKVSDYIEHFANVGHFDSHPDGVENYAEMKRRMGDFLYDMEKKHEGKTILIVTHETPACMLTAAALGLDRKDTVKLRGNEDFIKNGELRKIDFVPLPHNAEYELDLHRPYIDDIELRSQNGNGEKLVRVPDVFDCWFESGAMPYGENHYPFKKDSGFEPKPAGVKGLLHRSKGFPADFIAEGLDQTRGWFYSMIVLGVALFGHSPFKKVIVNGLVLAEDGQKMSKSKQNYPDPMLIVGKYGADSLRYYLMSSPVVRAQDLCFSERGVDEVTKKIVNRLLNVVSFYEMYAGAGAGGSAGVGADGSSGVNRGGKSGEKPDSKNVLDVWMVSRLNATIKAVTAGLEAGELDKAARPFNELIDDLSTWYLRRSRDRFKGDIETDKKCALETTRYVLLETAKLMAPFMPFLAEDIYGRLSGSSIGAAHLSESVHLESWPPGGAIDGDVINKMEKARMFASRGLEARMSAKINVRQPLRTLRVRDDAPLPPEYISIVKDEVNVKDVVTDSGMQLDVELDTDITPDLKEEGDVRELIRKIQDLRKEKKMQVKDMAVLVVPAGEVEELAKRNLEALKKAANLSGIESGSELGIKP